jgi:predicted small secreted protein
METRKMATIVTAVVAVALLLAAGRTVAGLPVGESELSVKAAPLGTGFTYQGRLTDGGIPANGAYDFEFELYDAASGGTTLGTLTVGNATVTDGLFTVQLNFGAEVFTGDARWLEIGVRPGDSSGAYTALSPRQALTAAPYALYAQRVAEHDHLGQTWTGSDNPLVVSGSFGGPDYAPLVLSNSHTSGDGLRVVSAGGDGVSVGSAGNPSTTRPSTSDSGFEVQGAQGDGLYVGQADIHGVRVYAAGEDGVHVWSSDRDGLRVWSAGEDGVHVESAGGYAGYFGGDVHITGAATGFFPRATWNSGWVSISQEEVKTLTHDVGGDPGDYFVDMQCRSSTWGISNDGVGGDRQSAFVAYGATYSALTTSSVKVYRRNDDVHCSEVRVRIWPIK